MKELILYFSNDTIRAYYIERKKADVFVRHSHLFTDDILFREFLKEINKTKARAIIEHQDTISKSTQIPLLSAEDINNLVSSNITEYFILDPYDYQVDYRITERNQKEKTMNLMMTAVKRDQVVDIHDFFKKYHLKMVDLLVMSDVNLNLLQEQKGTSSALLRIQGKYAWIQIVRNEKLFLHTSFSYDADEKGLPTEATVENIIYYLNFYSRQNFGETVEKIIIESDEKQEASIHQALSDLYDGEITAFMPLNLGLIKSKDKVNLYNCSWIRGLYPKSKPIYGKKINYAVPRDQQLKNQGRQAVLRLISLLLMFTILIQAGIFGFQTYMKSFYHTQVASLPEEKIAEVEKKLGEVNQEENYLLEKKMILQEINGEKIDYMSFLEAFQNNIPSSSTIDSLIFTKESIEVNFFFPNEENRTLDAASLVLALNKIDLFLPIQFNEISLDNTQEYLKLNLIYKPVVIVEEGSEEENAPSEELNPGGV